jgi:DNA-binding SARP family transcriptional activator
MVLGPLVLDVDDRPVALGPPMERAVLAWLALRAGRPVPVSALTEALWGDDSARSARKTIQAYVSALRRLLPPETVETVPDGHMLHSERESPTASSGARRGCSAPHPCAPRHRAGRRPHLPTDPGRSRAP